MKRVLLGMLFLGFVPGAFAAVGSVQVEVDHGAGLLRCPGDTPRPGGCTALARSGDHVLITLVDTIPSLITSTPTVTVHRVDERKQIASMLGLDKTPTAPVATEGTKAPGRERPPTASKDFRDALANLQTDISYIRALISAGAMADFPWHKRSFDFHFREMEGFDVANSDGTLLDKIDKSKAPRPAEDLAGWIRNVNALRVVPAALSSSTISSFELADVTEVKVEFKLNEALKPLITDPPPPAHVVIVATGWRIGTSAGFAGSGLVDHHYSFRTVIDKAAVGATPAETHREAVKEETDVANAEATYFIHLANVESRVPYAFSFGVGIATGVSGRLYGGFSWMFGNRGALTLGGALGQVQRLSRNIDPKKLGADVDPEATRRPVTKLAPFIALSWRFGN